MKFLYIVALLFLLFTASCKSNESSAPANGAPATAAPATAASPASPGAPANAPAVLAKLDICNLLTSDELKSVQGEAFKIAQRSDRQDGDFIVAQCYYQMPTMANSVVLNVTTAREAAGAHNPRDFWEQRFREADEADRKGKSEREREREKERAQKEKAKDRREGEEEEEGAPPERVKGLGDEAFWTPSRIGGALYVLKKDQYFRISIGGAGDVNSKLNKSKTLAQKVLQKL
ncbi:MAG: hypothetical protein ACXW18_03070 [Pyrinomonadaceae bacterium]